MNFGMMILVAVLLNAEVSAKVSYLVGSVILERNNKKYSAVLNTPVYVNDIITTGKDSKCEVQFANYSLIRIEPNSSIRIEKKEQTKKGIFSRIFAPFGAIITKVTKLNKGDEYEMRTDAAHAFIRGTTFKTTVDPDGSSQFSVYEGKIKVKSLLEGAKEIMVDENFSTKLERGQLTSAVEKLSVEEIENFKTNFKEFIDRGKVMDELMNKLNQKIDDTEKNVRDKVKKSCLFF